MINSWRGILRVGLCSHNLKLLVTLNNKFARFLGHIVHSLVELYLKSKPQNVSTVAVNCHICQYS